MMFSSRSRATEWCCRCAARASAANHKGRRKPAKESDPMSEQLKTTSKLVPAARKEGDALVASINGEIDLNNSPELRAALMGLLARSPSKKVVLNLAQVPYMDSSAVAVLVELLRKLNGGKNFLSRPP